MIKARPNRAADRLFWLYLRGLLRRHFYALWLVGELPNLKQDQPVLLLPNHHSWWDGFYVYLLNRMRFHRSLYLMMLEEQLFKQDFKEAFDEVNHANYAVLVFLHLSALTILVVSVFITRHMINVIRKRDMAADHLNRQLMQTSKLASIGQLSAGVAHEINNPLAIILTERQLLLDMAGQTPHPDAAYNEQFDDSMSQIDVQVQRCKRITQNLLRFARRTRSVIETVNINAFLGEVVELMEREARAGGIKFFVEFEEDINPLLSDPSQLQQVFLNLITNAIDAHEDKAYGSVKIMTRSNGRPDGVTVSIADSGCGIATENLEKIFDPFFTTKPVGKGTGLGLSICYAIVKRLGGEITVHSQVGEGTEFDIFLPYTPPRELIKDIENDQDAK